MAQINNRKGILVISGEPSLDCSLSEIRIDHFNAHNNRGGGYFVH